MKNSNTNIGMIFEFYIRHEHHSNGSGIDLIRFRFSKAETFSVKICVERIDDIGGQTFVNEITEQVVRVVSSGFQFYFNFRHIWRDGLNSGKKDHQNHSGYSGG